MATVTTVLNPCFNRYTEEMAQQAVCEQNESRQDNIAAAAIVALSLFQVVNCWDDYKDNIDDRERLLDKITRCANLENLHFCEKTMAHIISARDTSCEIVEPEASCTIYNEKSDSISNSIEDFINRQSGCAPCDDKDLDSELKAGIACATVNNSAHRFRATERRQERIRTLKNQSLASISHSGRNVAAIGQGAYSQSMQIHQSLQNIHMSCLRDNIAAVGYGLGGLGSVGVGGSGS